jgi:hypothetical protein
MGKPQQKEPPFIENQLQPIQIRATIAGTIQKEKQPSFRQKIRNPLPFSSEPTMPREQSNPHWVQYFRYWLYWNGGPKDIVPIHPNPEKPNKKHHTPAQIHWHRQMIRSLIRQKNEARVVSANRWPAVKNCPYHQKWGAAPYGDKKYIDTEADAAKYEEVE